MDKIYILLVLLLWLAACNSTNNKSSNDFKVEYKKFELDNGLDVIFHIDRSDPVVAVALTVHVGSAREKPGRTGFAHLFEHLLFLESENLGKGGLDKLSARIGGSGANGSTSRDRTNYYQTVPNDALEKMLWAEADKLGWFINTVTDHVLAKEKQVVKNEKRQGVDNRPYGHTWYVLDKNLYPEDHPYNWQVIGSLEDLQNATLDDVKEFYNRWYVPNNATLVVSGDFDSEQAKEWIHKYFDEIPRGESIEPLQKRPGEVKETIRLIHEDNFANLPELTLAWPAVEKYHPDAYALQILTSYLSEGKKAPLYKSIVEEDQLSSEVSMYHYDTELAGQVHLVVRAFSGKDLDSVYASIQRGLANFEKAGISEKDLNRIKAIQEMNYYYWLSSVLGKGFQLAQYNIFMDDPGHINRDIQNTVAVTRADIKRVYEKYIKDRKFVATSFVPREQRDLALKGSVKAGIVEEVVVQGLEEPFDASLQASYEPTPSSFDRSVEPPYGNPPEIKVPEIWEDRLSNGLSVFGVETGEVPLVQFTLLIEGGQLMDDFNQPGIANLAAKMMTRGTRNKTPEQLEEAIQQLGAKIEIKATKENLKIEGNTLARNYNATIDLLEEILFEPRWDAHELDLLKQSVISHIQQQKANPNSIASNTFNNLIYGNENILSQNILGTEESIQSVTMDDLKNFYANKLSPNQANMHVVGAINREGVMQSVKDIETSWKNKEISIPSYSTPEPPATSKIYFVDVPDAKQSVFRFGYPALAATDIDYYPLTVMNYKLGGGGFASRLMQEVREGKGYTYGIRSGFHGTKNRGPFEISTSVRTNITLEAAQLIKDILENFGPDFSETDMETTKSSLIKSNARAFETAGAKLYMLENISSYNWNYDYVKDRELIVQEMTVERIQELAGKYVDPQRMIWLVVGDANSQLPRMKELGFGEPVLIRDTFR